MKSVFTNHEIAHVWVHGPQTTGRSSSMSFCNECFSSYGTVIGRKIKHGKRTAYVLNRARFSNTTAKHQSLLWRAIPSTETVFEYEAYQRGSYCQPSPAELFSQSLDKAAMFSAKAIKARSDSTREWNTGRQFHYLEQAKAVNKFFGLRRKVDDKAIERLRERAIAQARKEAKEARERQIRLEAEKADAITAWINGEPIQFPYSVTAVYLRAVGDTMQTSRGVKVPLSDARRAFDFAQKVRARGWHRNGEQFAIGDYQLDAINEQGVVAGCHRVTWAEIERFAKTQGWA